MVAVVGFEPDDPAGRHSAILHPFGELAHDLRWFLCHVDTAGLDDDECSPSAPDEREVFYCDACLVGMRDVLERMSASSTRGAYEAGPAASAKSGMMFFRRSATARRSRIGV